MRQWQHVACIGCLGIILLGILILGGCIVGRSYSTQREPELPIRQFLRKQLEAFPANWHLEESDIKLWTSAADPEGKFSNAPWAVAVDFWYKPSSVRISKGLAVAHEQIFVYKSTFQAQSIPYPSEFWAAYWGDWFASGDPILSYSPGYIPREWSYHPSHANRFEFRCWGGDGIAKPEWCSFILRYEEYIIAFDTDMVRDLTREDIMTLEDLRRIIEVIDHEMADYLKRSTLRPGPRLVPTTIP